jgi:hypothetical protein
MKKITLTVTALATPLFAFAATDFKTFVSQIVEVVQLLIGLFAALALLSFFWGLAKFILSAGDEKKIQEGKDIMIWGTVGLFVLVSIWGILTLLYGELDFGGALPRIQYLPQ